MFKSLANAVRFLSIDQVSAANSGHLGMPLGMSDCLTALFKNVMKFDPENPTWPNRDRFVLSGGHGSAALYSLLHLTGYKDFSMKELKNFRKLGSKTSGHPEYCPSSGIEITTGPLGQGIANAVGMAIEERLLNSRLGDTCIDYYTYVVVGEGDLMEGISHEACTLAGNLSLGHIIVLFDKNNITIDGDTSITYSDDVVKRFESYNWDIQETAGYDEDQITKAIQKAKISPKPSIVICNTKIGYGTPRENQPKAHGGALTPSEREFACKYFDWEYAPFEIPEYIEKAWRSIGKKSHEICKDWYKNQEKRYLNFDFNVNAEIQKAFRALKKEYFVSRPFAATRSLSKAVLEKISEINPFLISGACDLGSSTGCKSSNMKIVSTNDFSGNYIHYGIREHAMGAIMNGISANKRLKCCGGTFFSFSDYMKPAIRMSALMDIPTIFIFSHDSIGVGEDGPTHQPIEQLAMLRSIPNLYVFRPADAIEVVECWDLALNSNHPSAIILTRQEVLSMRFSDRQNLCANGAYLLNDDSTNDVKFTLIASGSEVGIALELKKMLNDKDICANVVSIPCWELFDQQSDEYKNYVLDHGIRIGIEASNGFGWEKYLGADGLFFGANSFGVSCPGKEVFKYFGLTSKDIFDKITNLF